jgi:hypothetical protein
MDSSLYVVGVLIGAGFLALEFGISRAITEFVAGVLLAFLESGTKSGLRVLSTESWIPAAEGILQVVVHDLGVDSRVRHAGRGRSKLRRRRKGIWHLKGAELA